MDVPLTAFVVLATSWVVALIAESVLVHRMRNAYQATYVRAGSPTYDNLFSRNSMNWHWRKYVMVRGFSTERFASRRIRWTFELAFLCSWLRIAALAVFVLWLVAGPSPGGHGPNNSSKPTPLRGAA